MKNEKNATVSGKPVRRKALFAVGIALPTAIAVALGIKNKDVLVQQFGELQKFIKNGAEYSIKWIENLSDTEIMDERKKVQLRLWNGDTDAPRILDLFDKEISKRAWGDELPRPPSIHREHGLYLFNDD